MLHKSTDRPDRLAASHPHEAIRTACTPRRLCARCSMVKIITYRFDVFRRTFGRQPEPNEPIFFVANSPTPVAAPREELRGQLSEAARRIAVPLAPLLRLLELD